MNISHHAIDRYHQRWCPELTRDDAATQLKAMANVARPIREKSRRKGHELWATGEVRMVISHATTDRQPLVVTVLPPNPIIDVDAEMRAYLDDEDHALLTSEPDLEPVKAEYRDAGQEIYIAEVLISDARELLAEAKQRREKAFTALLRAPDAKR